MGGVFEERSGIPIDLKLVHKCIDKCLKLQYIINGNQLPEIIVREISCISLEMRKHPAWVPECHDTLAEPVLWHCVTIVFLSHCFDTRAAERVWTLL